MTVLTLVVPCYNSSDYLARCVDTLPVRDDRVEILLVDDGSTDATVAMVDDYAARFEGTVRAIHQPNGGHGAAINTGITEAHGHYLKIVDSDDWLDPVALGGVIDLLAGFVTGGDRIDVLISNFVYEKVGKKHKTALRYRGVLPTDRAFGWADVRHLRPVQYVLMHSLVYRTSLLRECGLELPKHTFYVDMLYSFAPMIAARTLYYRDLDLYHYYIGRADQSVNETVMLARIDQYVRVLRAMTTSLGPVWDEAGTPSELKDYLLHYLRIVYVASSALLTRAGTPQALADKAALWQELREQHPSLNRRLSRDPLCRLSNLPGPLGRRITVLGYLAARRAVGFS
jgi:glycosyltransferase involved in cell wall biosynthesis